MRRLGTKLRHAPIGRFNVKIAPAIVTLSAPSLA